MDFCRLRQYWIVDRFERHMTVFFNEPAGIREQIIAENEFYETPLLPGFRLPLGELLAEADKAAEAKK